MKLQDRIARWSGWRRHAPAVGSLVAHAVFGGAALILVGMSMPHPAVPADRPAPVLEITLLDESPAAETVPGNRQTPPAPGPSASRRASSTVTDATQSARGPAPSAQANEDDDVFFGGAVMSDVPLGLRGMLEDNPCKPRKGLPRGDCDRAWTETFASGHVKAIPEIDPPPPPHAGAGGLLGFGMGGPPVSRTPGVFRPTGSLPGGAASMGGVNDLVGRLPPPVPDPGFGD